MTADLDNSPARADQPRRLRRAWPALLLTAGCMAALFWANQSPDSPIPWQNDLHAAQAQAAAENRPVFLAFDSPGCGFCRRMDREVFSRPQAAQALNDFIPVRLDLARHHREARRFGVQAAPAFVVLSPLGEVRAATRGVLSLALFQRFLEEARL